MFPDSVQAPNHLAEIEGKMNKNSQSPAGMWRTWNLELYRQTQLPGSDPFCQFCLLLSDGLFLAAFLATNSIKANIVCLFSLASIVWELLCLLSHGDSKECEDIQGRL